MAYQLTTKNVEVSEDWVALYDQACSKLQCGQIEEAETLFDKLAKENPILWFSIACESSKAGDKQASLRRHIEVAQHAKDPRLLALCWSNIGHLFSSFGRLDLAKGAFEKSVMYKGTCPGYTNLGAVCNWLGEYDLALRMFASAVRLNPVYKEPYFNRSTIYLVRGDFYHGWQDYEERFRCESTLTRKLDNGRPEWDGSSLEGKRLMIYAEQGFGDTIHMLRYGPILRPRVSKLILCAQGGVRDIAEPMGCWDQICELGKNQKVDEYDCHISTMSLPGKLKTTLETIPACPGYVPRPDPEPLEGSFKVGICWQGSPDHKQDKLRSIPLAKWNDLLATPGVTWYSLQVGFGELDLDVWGQGVRKLDLSSWGKTMRVLASLDLVITIDTAVAHLAGAMGIPTWLMIQKAPDWRWLLNREDSPWYPSIKLFRQKENFQWDEVLARVKKELTMLVA